MSGYGKHLFSDLHSLCIRSKVRFSWQIGFGAFSYNQSNIPRVIRYIKNQEAHHERKKFLKEYKEFLTRFEIPYDEQYIFKELE